MSLLEIRRTLHLTHNSIWNFLYIFFWDLFILFIGIFNECFLLKIE